MKILHIAPDRNAAMVTAGVVHRIAQNVTPTWVDGPAAGLDWLQANRDTAAVILEAQDQSCAPFVEQLRKTGLTTPVVVVAASAGLEPALAALKSGADGYVVSGPTLDADLPRSIRAAIASERRRRELVTEMLSELGVARDRADHQLARVEQEMRRQTDQRVTSELAAAAARLAEVEAEQSVSLARETRICVALQQRLLELESALAKADERRASEAASFTDQLAKRHAEFTASLAQASQSRDALAAELNVTMTALEAARQAQQASAAAAAEQLRQREAALHAELAEASAGRVALEQAIAAAEAAHVDSRQRAALDLAGANERQAALEDLLAQEGDRRTALERQLTARESAHQDAERQLEAELKKVSTQLAELQSRHDAVLSDNAAIRAALAQQTSEAATTRTALERKLSDAQFAHLRATQSAEENLASAAARQLALEERLAQEMALGVRRERQLAAAESARRDIEERRLTELAAAEAHLAALQRQYEGDLADTRSKAIRRRMRSLNILSAYRNATRKQNAELAAQLVAAQARVKHLQGLVEEQRHAHERARSTSDEELQRLSAEHGQICQSFDRLQASFQTLERIAGEHAAERSRLAEVVSERDAQLSAQAERSRVAEQNSQRALAELQAQHRQALEANASVAARLQLAAEALRRELDASRTHAEALRGVAERVPDLQAQLERAQNERRRQFERAPYALCQCSESGTITDANHSFVTLLGRRRVEELRNKDFASAAHDSAGDLGWLLERARTTRKTETVETQWKTRDGRRLVVRLQALATAAGSVEIVAEDVSDVRSLEERLRQAQRMEAVGRLAAEVAVTCDAMLSDVARGADEWMARAGNDDVMRRYAERLLTDVMRASSFLRQLGAYSNEQVRALEPVSVQRVLRDLAPVLKRLVGDQIELVMPKSGGPFNVDVDAERLERVLTNVASYARERMPSGGQVMIDLASTSVGRRFVARYANVRPGDHVLITVTELPAGGEFGADQKRGSRSSDRPGVDLGVLVDLIASCGGHLWLEAQPAGNMVVKIHLPKPPAAASEPRGGRLSRLLRLTPALSA